MWTYAQSTGRLLDASSTLVGTGYAGGNCGKNPEGVNNPAMQFDANIGPLPQGLYTITAPYDNPQTGPYTMNLNPDPANNMGGRAAFRIHGDTTPPGNASEGCIIMNRTVRTDVWASGDRTIQVVA